MAEPTNQTQSTTCNDNNATHRHGGSQKERVGGRLGEAFNTVMKRTYKTCYEIIVLLLGYASAVHYPVLLRKYGDAKHVISKT